MSRRMYSIALTLLFIVVRGESLESPKWIRSHGMATGTDLMEMRNKAINDARGKAMEEAGIEIHKHGAHFQIEDLTVTDFYCNYVETFSKGLILEERNLKISDPQPLSPGDPNTVYKIEADLEALVAIQEGEMDPGFIVALTTLRNTYEADENILLTAKSSRSGYLTLLAVENDTVNVLLPNSLEPDNSITADSTIIFPSIEGVHLNASLLPGARTTTITFIAIVTREDIKFSRAEPAHYIGKRLQLVQSMLSGFAQWLYKIPLNKRSSSVEMVQVMRKGQ